MKDSTIITDKKEMNLNSESIYRSTLHSSIQLFKGDNHETLGKKWVEIEYYNLNVNESDLGFPFATLFGTWKRAKPGKGSIGCFYVYIDCDAGTFLYSFDRLNTAVDVIRHIQEKYMIALKNSYSKV